MALESGATDLVAFAGALRRVAADRVAFVAPLETEAQMLASVTPWTASEIKAAMTDGEP